MLASGRPHAPAKAPDSSQATVSSTRSTRTPSKALSVAGRWPVRASSGRCVCAPAAAPHAAIIGQGHHQAEDAGAGAARVAASRSPAWHRWASTRQRTLRAPVPLGKGHQDQAPAPAWRCCGWWQSRAAKQGRSQAQPYGQRQRHGREQSRRPRATAHGPGRPPVPSQATWAPSAAEWHRTRSSAHPRRGLAPPGPRRTAREAAPTPRPAIEIAAGLPWCRTHRASQVSVGRLCGLEAELLFVGTDVGQLGLLRPSEQAAATCLNRVAADLGDRAAGVRRCGGHTSPT